MMENQGINQTYNCGPNCAYITSLANQYGLAENLSSVAHKSLPDYLTFLNGSNFAYPGSAFATDCSPSNCRVNGTNILAIQGLNNLKTSSDLLILPELIATVKANPGKFNIASSGIGATNHLAAELFKAQTGLKLTHVPYRGGAQAGQDVAAGNAQMMFSASLEAKPFLDSGKTRAIAISSLKRSPAFPNIPTVAESAGLPDFEAVFWQGLVVPAGTPQPIIDRLHKVIAKIAADPEMIERFKVQGVDLRSSTPAEFKDHLNKEEKRWVTLIKEQGIKPE